MATLGAMLMLVQFDGVDLVWPPSCFEQAQAKFGCKASAASLPFTIQVQCNMAELSVLLSKDATWQQQYHMPLVI